MADKAVETTEQLVSYPLREEISFNRLPGKGDEVGGTLILCMPFISRM